MNISKMNQLFTYCRVALLVTFFFSVQAQAENKSHSKAGISFRVLTFERVKGLKIIHLIEGVKSQTISMHKNNFTGQYKSKSRTLHFSREAPSGKEADAKNRVSAGVVKVPPSLGSKILLIAVPSQKETYQFFPISDNFQKFQAGEMSLINLTKVNIATRLNGKAFKAPAQSVTHLGKVSNQKKSHTYPAEFFAKKGGKWKSFSSSYWQYEPDARKLAFCFMEPRTERIRLRTIRELPSVKEQ